MVNYQDIIMKSPKFIATCSKRLTFGEMPTQTSVLELEYQMPKNLRSQFCLEVISRFGLSSQEFNIEKFVVKDNVDSITATNNVTMCFVKLKSKDEKQTDTGLVYLPNELIKELETNILSQINLFNDFNEIIPEGSIEIELFLKDLTLSI